MKKLNEMSNEELTQFEIECKEAQKAIFTDIVKYENDSPEYNLLKTDFEKYAKLVVEIEKEKKLRKENEEKKETSKKENIKTKKENNEKEKGLRKEISLSEDSKSEIKNEEDYKQYKKTYDELIEELKETKRVSIPKTAIILAAETLVSTIFWMKTPMIFALLTTGAAAIHMFKRIKKIVYYEKINSDAKYLKKEIDKYENKTNKKEKMFSNLKQLFKFKKKNKAKKSKVKKEKNKNEKIENIDIIDDKLKNENNKTSNLDVRTDNKKTTKEKINKLKEAKKEIINGVYSLDKNQIIQDRVNVREICNFYGTNNTNPSCLQNTKEKVMVKNKVA